jgi:hypothetical protein
MKMNEYPIESGWYFVNLYCMHHWCPAVLRYFDKEGKGVWYTYRHRFKRIWKIDQCVMSGEYDFIFSTRDRFDETVQAIYDAALKIRVRLPK